MTRSTNQTLRKQAWKGRGVPLVAKHTSFIYTTDDDGTASSSPLSVTRNIQIGSKIDTRTSENMGPSKRALKRAAKKREMQRRGRKLSAEAENAKPVPRSVDSLSSLERMPAELLLCISDYLQQHAVASLALASRALLFRLGTRTLSKLDAASRLQVMDAISRDHAELVLCFACRKLHSPWLSLRPQTPQQPKFPCQDYSTVFDLYTTFHRRLNRTVIENCIAKSDADPTVLLKQVRQTRTVARNIGQETFYIQRSERPLLTLGFLVAKAQTVIVPASGECKCPPWAALPPRPPFSIQTPKQALRPCGHREQPDSHRRAPGAYQYPGGRHLPPQDMARGVPRPRRAARRASPTLESRREKIHLPAEP